jgi:hypothetical protein
MAVRLSALLASRPSFTPGKFLELKVDPRAIVRLEGLDILKNPVTSSAIETATFRLVV